MNKRTPKGVPRQAEVVQLATWKHTRDEQDSTIEILLPAGARPSDSFEAFTMSETVREWNTRRGDLFIIYVTDDVVKGDVVGIRSGERYMPGTLDFDECYYYLTETDTREEERFHRAQAEIIGRVVEVRRGSKIVETTLNLRPLRPITPTARIYQFGKGRSGRR